MTTTQPSATQGKFCWYELMTTDPEAATAFYTAVAPWTTQSWDGGSGDYTMLINDGRPFAGLRALPDEAKAGGAPPMWMLYVAVDDLDAKHTQATELGAKTLMPPTDIPGAGRFATLRDPQGAVFSLYQMKDGEDVDDTRGPGKISWHELATTDWEAAWTFYEALFGWTRTGDSDMGEAGTYALFGTGGEASDGGLFNKPAEMPGPPMWLCYATVADLDATAEAVKARGGQVVNGPMEVEGGDRIAQIVDPQGAMFALHQAAPQAG